MISRRLAGVAAGDRRRPVVADRLRGNPGSAGRGRGGSRDRPFSSHSQTARNASSPGMVQTSLIPCCPSGFSQTLTVAPLVAVDCDAETEVGVEGRRRLDRRRARRWRRRRWRPPCPRRRCRRRGASVAYRPTTSTAGPMNHWNWSIAWTAWFIRTPPPSVAHLPRQGSEAKYSGGRQSVTAHSPSVSCRACRRRSPRGCAARPARSGAGR